MRTALVLLAALLPAAAAAQTRDTTLKSPDKGDTLLVKGCLDGGALVATESEALDSTGLLAAGLTFRLTGRKALLKTLKAEHDGRLVSVTGTLKSALPRPEGQGRTLGGMRVTIGAPRDPNSPVTHTRRALPVLDVTSFEGGSAACER